MPFDKIIRTHRGADNELSRNNRGLVNGRGAPVGPDVSRPVGNPPPTRMNVLKLNIGLAGISLSI